MRYKKDLGKYGEDLACEYLIKNNYKIVERNFLCKQGEIDVIAFSQTGELVFVEVKTRKSLKYGMPCESVNKHKIQNIIFSSKYYILKHNCYNINIRYDVIEIYWIDSNFVINHLINAF